MADGTRVTKLVEEHKKTNDRLDQMQSDFNQKFEQLSQQIAQQQQLLLDRLSVLPLKPSAAAVPQLASSLLVSIDYMTYPITVNILHQVFDPYGVVENIVPVGFQAIVQYRSRFSAISALTALQGRNIYDGCCRMHIQLDSPTPTVVVKEEGDDNSPDLKVMFDGDTSEDVVPTGCCRLDGRFLHDTSPISVQIGESDGGWESPGGVLQTAASDVVVPTKLQTEETNGDTPDLQVASDEEEITRNDSVHAKGKDATGKLRRLFVNSDRSLAVHEKRRVSFEYGRYGNPRSALAEEKISASKGCCNADDGASGSATLPRGWLVFNLYFEDHLPIDSTILIFLLPPDKPSDCILFLRSSLLRFYEKCEDLFGACKVFDDIPEVEVVVFTAMSEEIQEPMDVQTGVKMILQLCLADGCEMLPILLVTEHSRMIDRQKGTHGHPLEIHAFFYLVLLCAQDMLDPEDPFLSNLILKAIKEDCHWDNLSKQPQSTLNSKEEWHRRIIEYCIKKSLQWNTSFARTVCKEAEYYENWMQYLQKNLALFRYHLTEHVCHVMRISPFRYYCDILFEVLRLRTEQLHDSLPYFSRTNAVRLIGVGRNEFIDIMNKCRPKNIMWKLTKTIDKEFLPVQLWDFAMNPWWRVCLVNVTLEEFKKLSEDEMAAMDKISIEMVNSYILVVSNVIRGLYHRELINFDVPVYLDVHFKVSRFEGFVSSREHSYEDPIEELLFVVFVVSDVGAPSDSSRIFSNDEDGFRASITSGSVSGESSAFLIERGQEVISQGLYLAIIELFLYVLGANITSYFMMGAVSLDLKSHAVTLYEAGELGHSSIPDLGNDLSSLDGTKFEGKLQEFANPGYGLQCVLDCLLTDGTVVGMVKYEKGIRDDDDHSADFSSLPDKLITSSNVVARFLVALHANIELKFAKPPITAIFTRKCILDMQSDITGHENVDWMHQITGDFTQDKEADATDYLTLELVFYTQTLKGTWIVFEELQSMDFLFLRPPDYYVERFKSDAHVGISDSFAVRAYIMLHAPFIMMKDIRANCVQLVQLDEEFYKTNKLGDLKQEENSAKAVDDFYYRAPNALLNAEVCLPYMPYLQDLISSTAIALFSQPRPPDDFFTLRTR